MSKKTNKKNTWSSKFQILTVPSQLDEAWMQNNVAIVKL